MKPARGRRGGWALLELLVVIAGASAMLALAVGLIFQMLKIDGAERARVVAAADLERLARDLRGDAHSASRPAEIAPGRLVLTQPGGRSVEYTARGREILRTVRLGEKADHREPYRLPEATAGRFEPMGEGPNPAIALVLSVGPARPGKVVDPGYRDYRIEAVPGRGHRHTGGPR